MREKILRILTALSGIKVPSPLYIQSMAQVSLLVASDFTTASFGNMLFIDSMMEAKKLGPSTGG